MTEAGSRPQPYAKILRLAKYAYLRMTKSRHSLPSGNCCNPVVIHILRRVVTEKGHAPARCPLCDFHLPPRWGDEQMFFRRNASPFVAHDWLVAIKREAVLHLAGNAINR